MSVDGPDTPPRRRWVAVGTVAFLVASLIAVGLALSGGWAAWTDLEAAATSRWRVRPLWLATALTCEVAALCGSGVIWACLFRSAGGRTRIPEAAAAWLGSNLGRYLPGKIWQVTGLVAYVRSRGDSGAGALATLIAFQAAVVSTGIALALVSLGAGAFESVGVWPLVAGSAVLVAALSPPMLRLVMRWGQRLLREAEGLSDAAVDARMLARAVLGSLVVWSLHGLGFLALLEGLVLGHDVNLPTALGVFSGSYALGYLALVAPGGLIVREGAMVGLLGVVAAIPPGPAAALALAARLWTTAAELLSFVLAAAVLPKRRQGR